MTRVEMESVVRPEGSSGAGEDGPRVVVVGGGPAGLTAAYELLKLDASYRPLVLEASDQVGGIARTEEYKGYRFDIGGHRFFTKVDEVRALWDEVMGDEFIDVPRKSRIYYQNKFYDYPLQLWNALGNLGPVEAVRILLSYGRWHFFPYKDEETFEHYVTNRFGARLYEHFFRTYTEKVWGIPCTEIRADWAAQRIQSLSVPRAVWSAITKSRSEGDSSSLIRSFKYPRLGPGQMWEAFQSRVNEMGGEVRLETPVTGMRREGSRIVSVQWEEAGGERRSIEPTHVVNSMPLPLLVKSIDPPPPAEVLEAADGLKFRDFLIVTLILDHADPFDDNWIYVHNPGVKVGRIQNFRSWSAAMVPDPERASIGMEYFCHEGDGLWQMSREELLELAAGELDQLGLAPRASVVDGTVIRQPKAYPVYDRDYKRRVHTIRDWVLTLENLQSVGRNGMHRYNNQDHSMLAALLAAKNIAGERHDIWNVNVERSYHEEFQTNKKARASASGAGGRPVPASA